jgi:hypothetical protein
MAFPKLSISLFPPKRDGTRYVANGSLRITLADAAALAEWLLAQPGEHDDYLNQPVISVPAFQYENQSKSGMAYTPVQLVDLDSQGDRAPQQAQASPAAARQAPARQAAPARSRQAPPEELPF